MHAYAAIRNTIKVSLLGYILIATILFRFVQQFIRAVHKVFQRLAVETRSNATTDGDPNDGIAQIKTQPFGLVANPLRYRKSIFTSAWHEYQKLFATKSNRNLWLFRLP